jgi:hypothetical protein
MLFPAPRTLEFRLRRFRIFSAGDSIADGVTESCELALAWASAAFAAFRKSAFGVAPVRN